MARGIQVVDPRGIAIIDEGKLSRWRQDDILRASCVGRDRWVVFENLAGVETNNVPAAISSRCDHSGVGPIL